LVTLRRAYWLDKEETSRWDDDVMVTLNTKGGDCADSNACDT
jgi:hypothetical protein